MIFHQFLLTKIKHSYQHSHINFRNLLYHFRIDEGVSQFTKSEHLSGYSPKIFSPNEGNFEIEKIVNLLEYEQDLYNWQKSGKRMRMS